MGNWKSLPKVDVVVDIETVIEPVTITEIQEFMAAYEPPANYKSEEAIAKHRAKTEANASETLADGKRFSIDGKRMICASLGIVDYDTNDVKGIESWSGNELSVITNGLVQYLDEVGEYRLIGWNHTNFDLPEIVKSFALTNVAPQRRPAKWDIIDLSKHPFPKTKMKVAAKAFGFGESEMDGSAIKDLYEAGDWSKIREYNKRDVWLTGKLMLAASKLFTF